MCFHKETEKKVPFEQWTNDTLYHLIVTIYNRIHNRLYISLLEKYVEWYKKQGVDVFVLPNKENMFPLENLTNVLHFVKKHPDFRDEKNIHFVFSLLFKNIENIEDFKKDYKDFIKDYCKISQEPSEEVKKEHSKEVKKEHSKEVKKESSKEVKKESSKEVKKEHSKEIKQKLSKKVKKKSSKEYCKTSQEIINIIQKVFQEKQIYKNRCFTTSVYTTSILIVSSVLYYLL